MADKIVKFADEELGTSQGDLSNCSSTRPSLPSREYALPAGLQLTTYRIDPTGSLVDADLEDAIARRNVVATAPATPPRRNSSTCDAPSSPTDLRASTSQQQLSSFWIDADVTDGDDAKELQDLITKISLSPFLQRHLAKPYQVTTPQVLSLNSAVFLVMRVHPPEDDTSHEPRYVAALCVKGLLLTVTTKPKEGKALQKGHLLNLSMRKAVEERELPEASISGALAMWLLCHVQRVSAESAALRKSCFALDKELDENADSVDLDDLVDLKNKVNTLIAVSEEQLECVETLKEGEEISNAISFSKLRGSIGLVMATAGANERLADRIEKKVADLRHTYESNQQDRINKRLEVLTILSAIFLPLTLMAGIWGMNFTNMPELQRENGYFAALASMLSVALTLIFVFYRFGWFSR